MKTFEEFTINEIVTADFRASHVFGKLGIDLNSNKTKTINEICIHFRLDPEIILDEIIEQMEAKVIMPVQLLA